MTPITINFTLEEVLQLNKNSPDKPTNAIKENIRWGIINVLQPVRDILGRSIIVQVGWRGPARNKRAGSVSSEHPNGQAADIDVPPLSNEEIMKRIFESDIPFYQIIDEQLYNKDGSLSQWIHISWRILVPGQKAKRMLKTARNTKTDLAARYTVI